MWTGSHQRGVEMTTGVARLTTGRPRSVDTDGVPAVGSIYGATTRLLERAPFNDISVAQILHEANVSRGTFYFYFASKFSVLRDLLEDAMNEIFEVIQPFLSQSPSDPSEAALERSIRAVTHAWHRHRKVLQAVNQHWHSDNGLHTLWLSIAERFISAGADEIERGRAEGRIASRVPGRTLAATLFWSAERVLHIAGLGIEPTLTDEEAAVDALVSMLRGTLCTDLIAVTALRDNDDAF